MPSRPLPRTIREVSTPKRRNSATQASAIGFVRQHRNERGGQAELCQRYRDIRLSAPESRDELRGLQESLQARRREPQHDLAESDGRLHRKISLTRMRRIFAAVADFFRRSSDLSESFVRFVHLSRCLPVWGPPGTIPDGAPSCAGLFPTC